MVMMSVGSLWAQDDISVTGKVVDEGGLPLEGVVVMLAGQNGTGVITDAAGQFRLNAPLSSSLSFLCMGYSDLIVKVPAGGVLNVVMKEDAQALDEVVVVGYGSQRKKDLTGGLTVVSEETLNMGSTSNLMDRLVGQVAGLSITTGNEAPGSNQTLLIRGQNSLSGSNSPLIVLDGIPYDGSLADIDPNIIESMSVLKDASSVAIYGSRGSNGVILLQTKQGQQGKVNVTYKGKFGLSQPMQEIQVMGPNEYLRFKQDMGRLGKNAYTGVQLDPLYGDVISASEKINFAKGVTNDWQSYVFREVFTMDHQLSFTGGTDKTSYMASVSYLQNPGVVYNSNYDRINVFATITQRLNNWLKVGLTSQFVHRESGGLTPNLEHAIKQSPYGVYKDETGMFYKEPMDYSNFPNPMKDVNADSKNTGRNVLMNGFVEITPLEGLSLKSQFGYNYRNTFSGTYYGRNTITGKENNGSASISNSTTTDWTWENVVRYEKEIGKHRFDLTGLFSMQQKMNVSSSQSGTGFVNDDSSFYRMDGAEKNIKISSGYWKESMMSGMLRVNYGYASKYMVTLTGRADGAAVFGKNNKYAIFPSVALT